MERPLRVSKRRPHEHTNGGFAPLEVPMPPLEASNGDVSVLFGREESIVSVSMGEVPLGSTESLEATVAERGSPGTAEEPSAASSDNPMSEVSADLAAVSAVVVVRRGRLLPLKTNKQQRKVSYG